MRTPAVKVDKDFLRNKIIELSEDDGTYSDEDFFVCPYDLMRLNSVLEEDLREISFDWENRIAECPGSPIMGIHALDNGLTFLGFYAGGDWEYPVYSIIYWDGVQLRGYTPKEGNIYNPLIKCAFGSECELVDFKGKYVEKHPDMTEERMNALKNIFDKTISNQEDKEAIEKILEKSDDQEEMYEELSDCINGSDIEFNWSLLEEDIRRNINVI